MEQQKQAAKLLITLASIGFLCVLAIILIVAEVDVIDLFKQEVDKTIEQEVIQEVGKMKREGKALPIPKLPSK